MKKFLAVIMALILVLALGIGAVSAAQSKAPEEKTEEKSEEKKEQADEKSEEDTEEVEEEEEPKVYTYTVAGMMGDEKLEIVLKPDGVVQFSLPEHEMITDVYEGTYKRKDNIVAIKGLTNVDETSDYRIPGLWPFINSVTGDAAIEVDDETGLYVPYEGELPDFEDEVQVYTYTVAGMMGDEKLEIVLKPDGVVQFSLPEHEMITDVYEGTYERDGDTVTIKGLRNVDETSDYTVPGLWPFINTVTGDATIVVDDETGLYTPAE